MIKIFVDAGSNLFKPLLKEKNSDIVLLPMTLRIEDKDYICYEDDFDVEEFSKSFYEELRQGKETKTSLVGPDTFYQSFVNAIKDGHDVICFTMASGISGTFNSARIARDMVLDEYKDAKIEIIDSKTAGFGEGLQALHAEELARTGLPFEEVVELANDFVLKTRSEFVVDNIDYLYRGGRVSFLVAKIAGALKIRVILKGGNDAKIALYKKAIGMKLAIKKMAEICIEKIRNPEKQTVYIAHCDNEKDATKLKTLLNEGNVNNIEIYPFDLVTGSHVGPGTIALFYVGENRE